MTDIDDAIERADDGYRFRPYGNVCSEDLHEIWELEADYRILAAEVKRLREALDRCRKGINTWDDK